MARVALVTGGSRGIGAAIAEALHREGAHLALLDRENELCRRRAVELGALPFDVDLADPQATTAAMHDAIDSFLRVVASDVTGDIERQRRAA